MNSKSKISYIQDPESRMDILELVASGMNAAIWEWDIHSGSIWWSPNIYEFLGYEEGEVELDYTEFVDRTLHPEDRFKLHDALTEHFDSGLKFKIEIRLRRKCGDYVWFETSGQCERGFAGKAFRMAGAMVLVDVEQRVEESDREIIDLVKSQNERLRAFTHIVSHNLRALTANLIGLIYISKREQDAEAQKEAFDYFEDNACKLHEMVEHLSEMIEAQVDLNGAKTVVWFQKAANSLKESLKKDFSNANAEVIFDFERAPTIRCIPAYLKNILLNLISNSIQNRSRQRGLVLRLSSYYDGPDLVFTCEDNGRGMDLDLYGKDLFTMDEAFRRNKDTHGIGLFLTRNLVEAMGGTIDVESQLGEGTVFTMRIRNHE